MHDWAYIKCHVVSLHPVNRENDDDLRPKEVVVIS